MAFNGVKLALKAGPHGAARAIEYDGKSLLPAGVVRVEGEFQRGDVVRIVTVDGHDLASGSANYAAADIERIRGQRSDRIAEVLGYCPYDEVVHRDNLAVIRRDTPAT